MSEKRTHTVKVTATGVEFPIGFFAAVLGMRAAVARKGGTGAGLQLRLVYDDSEPEQEHENHQEGVKNGPRDDDLWQT
jgi:hypothetical protein